MSDRRELILLRLKEILDGVAAGLGVEANNVFRNRGVVPTERLPALILLDGFETTSIPVGRTSTRGAMWKPGLAQLRPQVWSVLTPRALDEAALIGPEMSEHRRVLINAITTDAGIYDLLSTNGHIQYLGCDTDMQTGSTMDGQLSVNFAFHYLLDPSEL